tara:strand:- start:203 stop:442 length:240 start_codon:yes stop_codon:yes gene_type:complete
MNATLLNAAKQRAAWYKSSGQGMMSHMMMNEAKAQYIHMAQGGDGTITQTGNIREHYYAGKPDEFFQVVCDELGWEWRS